MQNTLSDAILEGAFERAKDIAKSLNDLNYFDQYGFTPLIEATIVDNYDMAAFLLRHGARPEIQDAGGTNALYWALDNNNYDMCDLLLRKGANANAYTPSSQPMLSFPILRENKDLIKLLVKYGGEMSFARDYISAKLAGHRFEMKGHVDIVDLERRYTPVSYEGFFLEATLSIVRDSLERFVNSYEANRLKFFPKAELLNIVETLRIATRLREFKHYNKKVNTFNSVIKELLNRDLLVFPVSFRGHAITFVKHNQLLTRCDRGVSEMTTPIEIQRIHHPERMDFTFIKNLMYKKQTNAFIHSGIHQVLGLEPLYKLPIKHQKTGNCSWANVESSVPTMLFMLLYDKINSEDEVPELIKKVMYFYKSWIKWDKDRAVEDCIRDFKETDNAARKACKVALLGDVLFQATDYRIPYEVERAKKMLPILKERKFNYVLKSYINIYIKGPAKHFGGDFEKLLATCGLDYERF